VLLIAQSRNRPKSHVCTYVRYPQLRYTVCFSLPCQFSGPQALCSVHNPEWAQTPTQSPLQATHSRTLTSCRPTSQLLQSLLIPSVLSSTTLHILFHLVSLQPRAKPKSLAVQSTNIPTRSALLRRHRKPPPSSRLSHFQLDHQTTNRLHTWTALNSTPHIMTGSI
jgi:hypothetical protein